MAREHRLIAWTFAGSDSGGGAGIQADLKTFHGLGSHGCSVICALTAQNSRGVDRIESVSPAMVSAQIQALSQDLPPRALKTGMLGNRANIEEVARFAAQTGVPVICDPVMLASSGDTLLTEPDALQHELFPHVSLLTPNLLEAETLTGSKIATSRQVEEAAEKLLSRGPAAVLIKGGHGSGDQSQDYYSNGKTRFWLNSPRIKTRHGHGTGCTLSAAITAAMAQGYGMEDALVIGKAYVNEGLSKSRAVGAGPGPVVQGGWPEQQTYIPWITDRAESGRHVFPDCGREPLGFYPIVDSLAWLERLLPLGLATAQLRIKQLDGEVSDQEIRKSIALAHSYHCRLFINDHWQLALKHDAYGVHLGQEDMQTADLGRLARSGIRLGVSAHGYHEMARALAVNPSYLALGPIFATTSKQVTAPPQGLRKLARWAKTLTTPLVAIGGIEEKEMESVLAQGVDGIAVLSAVSQAEHPERAVSLGKSLCAAALTPKPQNNLKIKPLRIS